MARRIKISSGVLNVRLHPHPEGIYGEFIEAIYQLRRPVRIRGDRYAMLSLLSRTEANDGIYTGLITTFTKIDTTEPWFDTDNLKEASEKDISRISIPDSLHPNATSFHFLFDARRHRFYVQTYSKGRTLSVRSAQRMLGGLAADLAITRRFNEAVIDIVQSKAGLEAVFALTVIKRVTVTLTKPNADVFDDDFDENIEGFLEELHSKKLTLIVEAEPRQSITPNEGLRRVSRSALEHGSVKTEGRDEQGATQRSTDDYPEDLHDKYDPDAVSETHAFRQLTGR
ncbi:hypothetical protein FHS95_001348 [Sphingomonas naasensis]|uniref:DUF4747 family protein n=1 Tax=Sphingomonas naasensis TaxID=1344951 RepID=A0A4S1W618_9SPHN|nr:DUF4747 family protein [Sphingomonas naasensis]NIJ19679.1 hypothetical protein [Sphingomonas naasensis]TGX37095.1 DUF4747 family protein [Sphingomonas naasensis]